MKKIITLIIATIFLFNLSFTQGYIPVNIDSLIHFHKSYETMKWAEEEVKEIDSLFRPKYYEGGVLIIPKKKKYITDTIYTSDVSGVSREKLYTKMIRYEHRNDSRIIPYSLSNACNSELDSFPNPNKSVLGWRSEVISGCYPNVFDFVLKEEYKNEFPNGLPKKIETYSYTIPGVQSMKWTEWKLKEKHRTDKRMFDDFIYSDSEGNLYYPYAPGYYSNFEDFSCDKLLTIAIQKALKLRGYKVKITGAFDNKSKAVLSQFQKDNGLPSCGTWQILMKELGIKYQ